jgi:hypothetical protein
MKSTDEITLTSGQKVILAKMLKIAAKRNADGKGYHVGAGYNDSWKKTERYAIQTKKLVMVPKKGLFVKAVKKSK